MFMTKKQFNALSIKDQVEVFNNLLAEGKNITGCCNECCIAYSTIRDRFKKYNYVYNRFAKRYENVEEIFPHVNEEKIINKVIEHIQKSNIVDSTLTVKPSNRHNLVNRSFCVDQSVLDEFIYFCDTSKFKQYDILTQFIREGIKRYSSES